MLKFFYFSSLELMKYLRAILNPKYRISTPLMIENPVRSPIVPPIADSLSTNLAALSFVIFSNFGVSKLIFM